MWGVFSVFLSLVLVSGHRRGHGHHHNGHHNGGGDHNHDDGQPTAVPTCVQELLSGDVTDLDESEENDTANGIMFDVENMGDEDIVLQRISIPIAQGGPNRNAALAIWTTDQSYKDVKSDQNQWVQNSRFGYGYGRYSNNVNPIGLDFNTFTEFELETPIEIPSGETLGFYLLTGGGAGFGGYADRDVLGVGSTCTEEDDPVAEDGLLNIKCGEASEDTNGWRRFGEEDEDEEKLRRVIPIIQLEYTLAFCAPTPERTPVPTHHREHDEKCEGACQFEGTFPLFCSEEEAIAKSPVGKAHLLHGQEIFWVANGRAAYLDGSYTGSAPICACSPPSNEEEETSLGDGNTNGEDSSSGSSDSSSSDLSDSSDSSSSSKKGNHILIISVLCFALGAILALILAWCCRSKKQPVIASAVSTEEDDVPNHLMLAKPVDAKKDEKDKSNDNNVDEEEEATDVVVVVQ